MLTHTVEMPSQAHLTGALNTNFNQQPPRNTQQMTHNPYFLGQNPNLSQFMQ